MTRDARILSLAKQVECIAGGLSRKFGYNREVIHDELLQAGWRGAVAAVDGFDPSRGVLLKTYAEWKIRGAMLDWMREEDPRPRGSRDRLVHMELHEIILPALDGELSRVEARAEARALVARARLDSQERKVIFRYYWAFATQKEIGRGMGLHESRVSQIHRNALAKLRMVLGKELEG
jgi:RNA polymerase sigma factor (sigma-70 family)